MFIRWTRLSHYCMMMAAFHDNDQLYDYAFQFNPCHYNMYVMCV